MSLLRPGRKTAAILLFLLLALMATAAWSYYSAAPHTNADAGTGENLFPGQGGAIAGHLPNMTEEEVREQMQKEADNSLFSFKINSRPMFANGGSAGNLNIENPSQNTYPFVVEIFLDATGEKLYDSGGILPDHHITNAPLLLALPAGTYAATAYINAYNPDTLEYCGRAAAELTITIKE